VQQLMGRRRLRPVAFAALGVVAVALACAAAELFAAAGQRFGLLRTAASPVDALGAWFITVTPQWLKNWAISQFGTGDKQALLIGMTLTVGIAAVLIGLLARRRMSTALAVCAILTAGALVAVVTRADSHLIDIVPTVLGALLGLVVLGGGGQIAGSPIVRSGSSASRAPLATGTYPFSSGAATAAIPLHRRRQFLRLMTFGAVLAAAAGALSRLIPSASEVEASRARIAIPVPRDSQPIKSGGLAASSPADSTRTAGAGPMESPTAQSLAVTSAGPTAETVPDPAAPTAPASATTAAHTSASGPTASVEFPKIQGLSPFITPTDDFYRIDTALAPPLIRAEDWSVRIHGMVRQEVQLSYFALMAEAHVERSITLACVSNPVGGHLVGNASWIGVRLDKLLERAGLLFGADCVLATSVDGFTSTTPLTALTDGRDALLAVAMNGAPLPIEHGFPVRMIVPGLYGYVSATKWVIDLEVTTFAKDSGYWTSRGYAERAPVKMSSRIDVPVPYTPFSPGDRVTVAGMAWAEHAGISAVQVQIDGGAWRAADLAGELSIDTWRQWRYQWIATAGAHIVRCRAVDVAGVVQDATVRGVLPDGATGYASLALMVS
jgi:DMSO/TMAO reductase YedYZ molybdopterin-dependent catalytic subunit